MRAMVCRWYGPPEVLHVEDLPRPVPGPDDLLVRIRASSVNAIDWHFLRGEPILVRLQYGLLRPKIRVLGYDMAGTVESVGERVTRFRPGDDVFGGLGFGLGGFAEYACIGQDGFVARKPGSVTFEAAAAVPGAAVSALIGLRDRGSLKAGQRVLVNGSSGGVGTFAVQIARALGAEVTAVCSTDKVEMVGRLGADRVVDYTREDFTRAGDTWDLLLDNVGNRRVPDMLRTVSTGGTVVIVGFTSMGLMMHQSLRGPRLARARGVTWSKPASDEPTTEHAETLAELLERGAVVPEVEATYGFEDIPEAMRHIETGHARAKIVVRIGEA